MPFRRLYEKAPRWAAITNLEGFVASVVAHALLIASVVSTSGDTTPPSDEVPESFRWVEFLIPKDRPGGSKLVRETVTYFAPPAPGGAGTLPTPTDDSERLQVMKSEGTSQDELAAVATPPAPSPELPGDTVLTVLEVDSAAARYDDSAAPPYPPALLAKKIEGTVAVQYVVDTTGRADVNSFVVLSATHDDFAASVRRTLPDMRFRPAVMGTRRVRQLVQQLFSFKIDTTIKQSQTPASDRPRA